MCSTTVQSTNVESGMRLLSCSLQYLEISAHSSLQLLQQLNQNEIA